MRHSLWCVALIAGPMAAAGFGAVKSQEVRYTHDGAEYVGYLAYDDEIEGKRPGVLVVHEWWGLNDYAKKRADRLAELGYVAFAPDMYGKGQVFEHPKDAGAMAGKVRENVAAWRGRAKAGLDILAKHETCDDEKLAAIGYCFGGSTALQLAYSGADLDAVVTFHAALPAATAEEAKAIKGQIQINHGAADSFIPYAAVEAFKKPLNEAKTPWTFIAYGGAKHSFTVADIDAKNVEGLAYDERADRQSWRAMKGFLEESFAK